MKRRLYLIIGVVAVLIGIAKAAEQQQRKEPDNRVYTICINKEDISKEDAGQYKNFNGICMQKVDGTGYACVRKSIFQKSNCKGMRICTENELENLNQ